MKSNISGMGISRRLRIGATLCSLALFGCLTLLAPVGALAALTDEQKTKISADLAAKKSYAEIITSAVATGITVEDVVSFLIQAKGAAPGAVHEIVNAAIMAGYDAEKIIAAALTGGADMQTVFNAAHTAGVEHEKISTGALAAGYSQSQIADSLAHVDITGGEVGPKGTTGGKASPSAP